MLTQPFFFLLRAGRSACWCGRRRRSSATQEDPLGDRLEELQSQAMVASARAPAAKKSGPRHRPFAQVIALVPGGEDWMTGSERLLAQAGVRRRARSALYCIFVLLFVLALLARHRLSAAR